jgi:hypothetical protein
MPYTDEELERAAERAMNFDPSKATRVIDATPIREIAEATEQIRRAQARQLEAVQAARARGISWNLIAVALGVSRQAARQRLAEQTVSEDAVQKAIANLDKATQEAMANLDRAWPNITEAMAERVVVALSAAAAVGRSPRTGARRGAKKATAKKAPAKRTSSRQARG